MKRMRCSLICLPLVLTALADEQRPSPLKQVAFEQQLDHKVPQSLVFCDETGTLVPLDNFFKDKRPVVLALVYYRCPMLCTLTLNGLLNSLRTISFNAGQEFQVLAVSFDAREKQDLAAAKKREYVKAYARPGAESGWHFLTGDKEAIRQLTESVGFRFSYDAASNQFAHAAGIVVLTPTGRVSRYLFGVEFSPRDLRLAMVEASQNKIGTLADQLLLFCFHYDPVQGKYGWAIMTSLRIVAGLTVLGLAGAVTLMLRRDKHRSPSGGYS